MNQSNTNVITTSPGHLAWLDNLRTFIVSLVVLLHAGGVYEVSGTWASFWIVDDPATNNLSGLVIIIMDIFLMPVLFLPILIASLLGSVPFINAFALAWLLIWMLGGVLTLLQQPPSWMDAQTQSFLVRQ